MTENKIPKILVGRLKSLIKEANIVEKEILESAKSANAKLKSLKTNQEEKVSYNGDIETNFLELTEDNNKVHFLTILIDDYASKIQEVLSLLDLTKIELDLTKEEQDFTKRLVSTIGHPYRVINDEVVDEPELKSMLDKAQKERQNEIVSNFKANYENSL